MSDLAAARKYQGLSGDDLLQILVELAGVDYELCERSFFHFFKAAWSILEPTTPLLSNWHQLAIAEYLEAAYQGDIKRLIINMPPRYSKSLLVTVMFPAWCWIKNPALRFINASYAEDLATKHAVDRRILMQSDWYQAAWAERFKFSAEQNQKTEYINDRRGSMVATGMLGSVTGKGGDFVIIDDPHNPKKAESEAERQAAVSAFDSTFTTRLDNKKTGRIIVVMQRLHYKDLTGHLLDKNKTDDGGEKWTHLNLPVHAPKKTVITLPQTGRKIVRNEGDLLHPAREGERELATAKTSLGSYNFAGQYEQNPTPRSGGIFSREYWRYWKVRPPKFDEIIQSWDMTFKDLITSDYVVGLVLGRVGADIYILDCIRKQMGIKATCNAVIELTLRYPEARLKLVEDKANGPGVVDLLKSKIPGLVLENPQGSKIERAALVEPTCESGNVHFPHPDLGLPWVDIVIDELAAFPRGANDDTVDAFTQGVKRLQNKAHDRLKALGTF